MKIGTIGFVITLSVLIYSNYSSSAFVNDVPKYINVSRVYNEFTMTVEYQYKLDSVKAIRLKILDSISENLEVIRGNIYDKNNQVDKSELQFHWQRLQVKREYFEKDSKDLAIQYKSMTVKQMNGFIIEYGEQMNESILFGATEQGSIMFAKPELDVTEEVIIFINNRYEDNQFVASN